MAFLGAFSASETYESMKAEPFAAAENCSRVGRGGPSGYDGGTALFSAAARHIFEFLLNP